MSLSRLRTLATCLHVLALLAVVEASIRWVPLPRLAAVLGVRLDLEPAGERERSDQPSLSAHARRQLRTTWRLDALWPFRSGPCLRRSLVAARLLRRSGAAVRIGFPRVPGARIAHAWVEIDGCPIEDVSSYQAFERPATGAR